MPVNTKSARETFYKELIQNTNLPTNHNFAFIITEINKEIEHHTQQRYPITYASKDKGKLQTPAVTHRKIQPLTWKKNRIEFPSNPFYHYTPESTINISSTDVFPSTATLTFGRFPFQSRQKKTELLGPYDEYFEGFNSQSSIPSGLQLPPPPPDFRISDPWKAAESEKEEKELEDQEFTYQHPITENLEQNLNLENLEIETPNHQRQNNPNPELINQQNLPSVIVINQLPINSIAELIQQPLQLPPQQPVQQQLLQQPPQPPNLDPMAYTPIAKLDNFTSKEDNAQVWLNNVEKPITANRWNNAQAIQAIPYFLKDTEKLKQSSLTWDASIETCAKFKQLTPTILQHHRYSTSLFVAYTLQDAVTCARDFKFTESEANYVQAINLVINESSELDSKLKKFSESINKRLEGYLADNHIIYQPPQRCNNQGNSNCAQNQLCPSSLTNQQWKSISKPRLPIPNLKSVLNSKLTHLPTSNTVINLSVSGVSSSNLLTAVTSNLSTTAATNNLSTPTNPNTAPKLTTQRNPKTENDSTELEIGDSSPSTNPQFFTATIWIMPNYLSLLVTPEDTIPNNQELRQTSTSNISPATITEDESLNTIFPFELEEPSTTPLFSRAALKEKPITTMYTDVKIDGHPIKLILDNGSADSIIT
ncbi:hypothetical protein G9A89_000770 [Geosiphon pyriformis]|nr:hypothetical protein G9A89_000770 [Geosiphon pyriformis]